MGGRLLQIAQFQGYGFLLKSLLSNTEGCTVIKYLTKNADVGVVNLAFHHINHVFSTILMPPVFCLAVMVL